MYIQTSYERRLATETECIIYLPAAERRAHLLMLQRRAINLPTAVCQTGMQHVQYNAVYSWCLLRVFYRSYIFHISVLPVYQLIQHLAVTDHQFVHNMQSPVATDTTVSATATELLADCTDAVRHWFLTNNLMLKSDQSEIVALDRTVQLMAVATVNAHSAARIRSARKPARQSMQPSRA